MVANQGFRVAAFLWAVILLATTLSAGARYAYCAMAPMAGAHCACAVKARAPTKGAAVQPVDCQRFVTVGALPPGTKTAPADDLPFAPLVAAIPGTRDQLLTVEPMAALPGTFRPQQRAGPYVKGVRVRSMVFLL